MVVGVRNLLQQQAHVFQQLEAVETMKIYIAHNIDGNEDLLASLEIAKSKVVVAHKLVEESVCLLKKGEKKNETS